MDPSQIGLFDLAERKLDWTDRRQALLSQDVANADTPGYQQRDLMPFQSTLANLTMTPVQTSPLHMAGLLTVDEDSQQRPGERAVDGNTISVEDELTKIADTDSSHQLVTGLYHKYMGMFMTALGK